MRRATSRRSPARSATSPTSRRYPGGSFAVTAGTELLRVEADGTVGTLATGGNMMAVAATATGTLYVVSDSLVQRLDGGDLVPVAGRGCPGAPFKPADPGDGGPATDALLAAADIAVTPAGDLLIADWMFSRIRRVDAAGTITTLAGGGGRPGPVVPHDQPCGGASPDYGIWNYFEIAKAQGKRGTAVVRFGTSLSAQVKLEARRGGQLIRSKRLSVPAWPPQGEPQGPGGPVPARAPRPARHAARHEPEDGARAMTLVAEPPPEEETRPRRRFPAPGGVVAGLTALVALVVALAGLVFDFVPSLRPDPRTQSGADLAVVAVERNVTLGEWMRRTSASPEAYARRRAAYMREGGSAAGLRLPGELAYVDVAVRGFKRRGVVLSWALYDARTQERTGAEGSTAHQATQVRLGAPTDEFVAELWIEPRFDARRYFVRTEAREPDGTLLAVADSEPFRGLELPVRGAPA